MSIRTDVDSDSDFGSSACCQGLSSEDDEDGGGGGGSGGGGAGGGIFELEDIERTIEEELVRQAAAWERGASPGVGLGPGPGSVVGWCRLTL
jgi:hypothetical protein